MSKLILTRLSERIVSAVWDGNAVISLNLSGREPQALVGDIYIGRVKNLAKNISAAFIEIAGGQICYCNLSQKQKMLKPGDEFPVQVIREAVKTKDAVVSRELNLPGKYIVLAENGGLVSVSSKILKKKRREELQALASPHCEGQAGFILRTNSEDAEDTEILREIRELLALWHDIREKAAYRTCFSKLYGGIPEYLKQIQDLPSKELTEIVTDQRDLFQEAETYLAAQQSEDAGKLRFYEDPLLALPKLYSLETVWERALQKRVWLKSGGYLVIEPTEALTVIDVNTGKYDGHKNREETFFKINREAAKEIAFQLRLRNLSGIIIVDFIDMESEDHRNLLMQELGELLRKDPIKAVLVEMTKLHLVEITRKKVCKPIYEQ
ncbi:ribonuclease E/G [Hominifimenecus sp. rT4P-3]|uniref:ribonuclease E/G n=1 Tax=Hominifimenecus sp. rT4P-3 TaxID=3242979 RepID=UPI003DA39793